MVQSKGSLILWVILPAASLGGVIGFLLQDFLVSQYDDTSDLIFLWSYIKTILFMLHSYSVVVGREEI